MELCLVPQVIRSMGLMNSSVKDIIRKHMVILVIFNIYKSV